MTDKRVLRVLSIAALILALGAIIMGERQQDGTVTVNLRDLAATIGAEQDHLDAAEVQHLLTSGAGLDVIDLRDSAAFALSHIPGARRCPIESLLDFGLRKDVPLLLYSEGGLHSAQAWMLLRASGRRDVYTLKGGWKAWQGAHSSPTTMAQPPAPRRNLQAEPREDEKLPWEC